MPFIRAAALLAFVLFGVAAGLPTHWFCRRLGLPTGWIGRGFCRGALALLGVEVRIEGDPMPTSRLLVANHVSWVDVLALGGVEPLCFLAKREVASWPLIGRLARTEGAIFVDRRRGRGIIAANREMAERMRDGGTVVLFPEGTTYDGRRRGRFLTSHLACLRHRFDQDHDLARYAAQPVAIAYSNPIAAWVGEATLLPHLWAMVRQRGIVCHLVYGMPIPVARGFDRKRLGAAVAEAVEDLLQRESATEASAPEILARSRASAGTLCSRASFMSRDADGDMRIPRRAAARSPPAPR